MEKVYTDTPTWVVDGSQIHHPDTFCLVLAKEKALGKVITASNASHAEHMGNICRECRVITPSSIPGRNLLPIPDE